MIKESIIFEGTVGNDINDIIPNVINRRNELNKDVFIRWNGATIRVTKEDDKNSILKKYYEELDKVTFDTNLKLHINGVPHNSSKTESYFLSEDEYNKVIDFINNLKKD